MEREVRTAVYDGELGIEAYRLRGLSRPFPPRTPEYREEVERACTYMEEHYAQRIGLDQLCRCAGLSKSTLLRAFGRTKGVTPYGYLEKLGRTPEGALRYLGVALCGEKKKVNQLTGSLPLLR